MGRLIARLATVLLVLLIAVGGLGLWGHAQFTRPGPLDQPRDVVIPSGSGLEGIANTLASSGIIDDPRVFSIAVKLSGMARSLKAGEYHFAKTASPREVMHVLIEGQTVVRRLTIAEGLTVRQTLDRLSLAEGLVGQVGTAPTEGTLLPETYHFSYGDTRAELLRRMRIAMLDLLAKAWPNRDSTSILADPNQALVLASIVEKETALAKERPLVAGVFFNRLKRGMRLQSDPTVAYGIDPKGLDRALSKRDLKQPTPYNTYVNKGLPPGPIANPGRASIEAVLHPAETDFLYFVADGSGGHAFARTLAEHNRNVAQWRKSKKASGG